MSYFCILPNLSLPTELFGQSANAFVRSCLCDQKFRTLVHERVWTVWIMENVKLGFGGFLISFNCRWMKSKFPNWVFFGNCQVTSLPFFWCTSFFILLPLSHWGGAVTNGQGQPARVTPLFANVQKQCGIHLDCETSLVTSLYCKNCLLLFPICVYISQGKYLLSSQDYLITCRAVVQKLASPFFIYFCLLILLKNSKCCERGISFSLHKGIWLCLQCTLGLCICASWMLVWIVSNCAADEFS